MSIQSQKVLNWEKILSEYTLEELSNLLPIKQETLKSFIYDDYILSVSTLVKLYNYTGYSLEYLLGLDEENWKASAYVAKDSNEIRVARWHEKDMNYRWLPFRTKEGLETAKKLLKLTDLELKDVNEHIDFLSYRKKLKLSKESVEES